MRPAFYCKLVLNGNCGNGSKLYRIAGWGLYIEFIKLTPDVRLIVIIIQPLQPYNLVPLIADFTVSTPFENNTFITVNLTGGGNLYQLVYPDGILLNINRVMYLIIYPLGTYY